MAIEVTIALPEEIVELAKRIGNATDRDVSSVLKDTLELLWMMWDNFPASTHLVNISSLSDRDVLEIAESKMDATQNQRLGELQELGKATGLTEAQRYELLALLQIYQIGQLRKSEGLAEAVVRGLKAPLPA